MLSLEAIYLSWRLSLTHKNVICLYCCSRLNPMGLIVALDDAGEATGTLFWDDGEELGKVTVGKQ